MTRRNASLLLVIGLLQWLVPLLPLAGIGRTIGAWAKDDGIPPELPPGLFFSIWGVIFALYLGFAILAVRRPGLVHGGLARPLIIAGAGNVVWMLAAQLAGNAWLNFVLLLPILVFAWESAHRMHSWRDGKGRAGHLLACALTGLLAGWLAVAVSIFIPGLIRSMRGLGASDQVWISLWTALVPAAVLARLYARFVSRDLWFFAALAWGLAGIAVNNWGRLGTHWLAIMTVAAGLYVLWRRACGPRLGAQATA